MTRVPLEESGGIRIGGMLRLFVQAMQAYISDLAMAGRVQLYQKDKIKRITRVVIFQLGEKCPGKSAQSRIRTNDLLAEAANALSTKLFLTNLADKHSETLLIMTFSLISESVRQNKLHVMELERTQHFLEFHYL